MGTLYYLAPEVIETPPEVAEDKDKFCQILNSKSDMWSVGVILYVLLSCKFPFEGKDDYNII